jgi:hypothetical protein
MSTATSRDAAMRRLIPGFTVPFHPETTEGAVTVQGSPQSALPTMLVRRARKKIGSYLISHRLLLVEREEDRDAAAAALTAAGFDVLPPLERGKPGEALLRLAPAVVGAWGNIIAFELRFPSPRNSPRVALYDLDTRALCVVSDVLTPYASRALALMGVWPESFGTNTLPDHLRDKLEWQDEMWGWSQTLDGPAFTMPGERKSAIVRTLTADAAARVPNDVALAVNEIFAVPVADPFVPEPALKRYGAEGFWSYQHGVLEPETVAKLRDAAPLAQVTLPDGWSVQWDRAMTMSPSHAPALTALFLHDIHPEWWGTLTPYWPGTMQWLLGHRDKMPRWMRDDETDTEEGRFNAVVTAVVAAIDDLDWLVPTSQVSQACALCGRAFRPSMLAAGHVAQLRTAAVCHLCVRILPGGPAGQRSPALEAGATAAVGEVILHAGRVISHSMLPALFDSGTIDPVTMILLQQVLPTPNERGWVLWLAKAGVLGEGWRPSRGYISIAADGHECRSAFERFIDDYLWVAKIPHEIEPTYPYDADLNPNGSRADWQLPDGTFVEAAGLMSQSDYAAKMARKTELAAKYNIPLLVVTETDLPRLDEVFAFTRP